MEVEDCVPSARWVNSAGFGGLGGGGGGGAGRIIGFLGIEEAGNGPRSNGEGIL